MELGSQTVHSGGYQPAKFYAKCYKQAKNRDFRCPLSSPTSEDLALRRLPWVG